MEMQNGRERKVRSSFIKSITSSFCLCLPRAGEIERKRDRERKIILPDIRLDPAGHLLLLLERNIFLSVKEKLQSFLSVL